MTNYYKILGVKDFASTDEIKTAYRKLSKKFHPDVNQGDKFFEERFKEIQSAYEALNDALKKDLLDEYLKQTFSQENFRDFQNEPRSKASGSNENYSQEKDKEQTNSESQRSSNQTDKTQPLKHQKNYSGKFTIPGIVFLAIIGLLTFSVISSEKNQYNETSKDTSQINIDSTASMDTIETSNQTKKDTIYKDFYYEDTLKNGCRFGMTLSEWNRHLAILASKGIIKDLSEMSGFIDLRYTSNGSLRGFISVDNSTDSKSGFYLSGLFVEPESTYDTVKIFRLNGKYINEPILIGLQLDYEIPPFEIPGAIDVIVSRDKLEYKAGPSPMLIDNSSLTKDDFSDFVGESLSRLRNKNGSSSLDNPNVSKSNTTETLFTTDNFFSIVEVKEYEAATVTRGSDYKIISISNAYRDYSLSQKVFSKKQFNLNIFDYMTKNQQDNYNDSIKTKKLIEKNLNPK